ncbi:MAG: hypothetical protein ACLTZN_03205 [Streptococcus sp.]
MVQVLQMQRKVKCRTKDFIYYASAAVLLAVTTQVAQADEVATQTPSITEGNQSTCDSS